MDTNMKALLNLQSLEFSSKMPPVRGRNGLKQSIDRLRRILSIQVLREYDFRKRRYGASCVVPMDNGICTGCQVALSVRTRRLAKHHVTECEHCGRLLYNPERHRRMQVEIPAA